MTNSPRNSSLNDPVERSKLVLAVHPAVVPAMRSVMRPAVRHPNQIYKQKFMKNAGAKLQALQPFPNLPETPDDGLCQSVLVLHLQ